MFFIPAVILPAVAAVTNASLGTVATVGTVTAVTNASLGTVAAVGNVAVGAACASLGPAAAPVVMMAAPGAKGLLISRAAFEANSQLYFELLRKNGAQAAVAKFQA